MAKTNHEDKDLYNRLLHKNDFIRRPDNTSGNFSDTETNIALLIILFVIILLFWVPLSEIFQ